MKKIVMTVVVVTIAAIAAQAQGIRDARFFADCLAGAGVTEKAEGTTSSKPAVASTTTATAATTTYNQGQAWGQNISDWTAYVPHTGSSAATAPRAAGWSVTTTEQQQKQEGLAMAGVTKKAELAALRKAEADYEAYLKAQEEAQAAQGVAAATATTEKPAATQPTTTEKRDTNWFSRLMGFEKYEGETDEQWQSRLYYMAIK